MSSTAEEDSPMSVSKSLVASRRDKRAVLSRKRKIDDNLQAALVSIAKGDISNAWEQVLAIQQDVQGIGSFLGTIIEPELYDEEKVVGTRVAEQFLAIPELLEATLLQLSTRDIMGCYGVNRTFRDTIEGSPKLQRHLRLQPAGESTDADQCFKMKTDSFLTRTAGPTTYVTIRGFGRLPLIGSRWRKMFLMQPAVFNIHYRVRCQAYFKPCLVDRKKNRSRYTKSVDGVKIGDILETAEMLLDLHRECERGDFTVLSEIVKCENELVEGGLDSSAS